LIIVARIKEKKYYAVGVQYCSKMDIRPARNKECSELE
jgi:hypothetical protein